MNPSASELHRLIHACLDGHASDEETAQLNSLLRSDAAARDLYLQLTDMHSCLSVDEQLWVEADRGRGEIEANRGRGVRGALGAVFSRPLVVVASALCLVAIGVGFGVMNSSFLPQPKRGNQQVATFGELRDCRWVSPSATIREGDAIRNGQRVELSSGSANLHFASGAQVRLIGPAILEPQSGNGAFLLLGQVSAVAETPQSKGFTLQTRTAQLVDIGTRFVASAAADGQCRVDVSAGSAEVRLEGIETVQHLTAGDALCIEPGERQIMTRIESGDETPAFRFPTIEPPSSQDYADQSRHHATIRVLRGTLKVGVGPSGPVSVLLDGRGQSVNDAAEESAFFSDNKAGSAFLMDLGQAVAISKINTYSWHKNTMFQDHRHRAVQKYTLYAYAGDELPPTDGELVDAGWVRLARVNSDDYFRVAEPLDRPAQQACSITAARGTIGRYRYLLWEVEATVGSHANSTRNVSYGTFYGEFDVYAEESR